MFSVSSNASTADRSGGKSHMTPTSEFHLEVFFYRKGHQSREPRRLIVAAIAIGVHVYLYVTSDFSRRCRIYANVRFSCLGYQLSLLGRFLGGPPRCGSLGGPHPFSRVPGATPEAVALTCGQSDLVRFGGEKSQLQTTEQLPEALGGWWVVVVGGGGLLQSYQPLSSVLIGQEKPLAQLLRQVLWCTKRFKNV